MDVNGWYDGQRGRVAPDRDESFGQQPVCVPEAVGPRQRRSLARLCFPHALMRHPSVCSRAQKPYCVSLAWSADGSILYSGYTDGQIRVWAVGHSL
jgi:hypothetical protein